MPRQAPIMWFGRRRAVPSLLDLEDILPQHEAWVGGKARGLGRLLRAGFSVPPGFVLTAAAYDEARRAAGAGARLRVPARLIQAMEERFSRLWAQVERSGARGVIARSSASDEDRVERSFAGVYESYGGIRSLPELVAGVEACWASLHSPRARLYRGDRERTSPFMAVLVQLEVRARWSGVVYTQDPLGRAEDRLCIELAPGPASRVVEGSAASTIVYVSRSAHEILEVKGCERGAPEVPDSLVFRIADVALAVERALAAPQDIEWVFREGELFLVQARPARIGRVQPPPSVQGYRRGLEEPFTVFGQWLELQKAERYGRALAWIKGPRFRRDVRFIDGILHVRTRSPRWTPAWEVLAGVVAVAGARRVMTSYAAARDRFLGRMRDLRAATLRASAPEVLYDLLRGAVESYLKFAGRQSIMAGHLANLHVALLRKLCRAIEPRLPRPAEELMLGLPSVIEARDEALWALVHGPPTEADRQAFVEEYGYIWADGNPKDPGWQLSRQRMEAMLKALGRAPQTERPRARLERQRERRETTERLVHAALDRASFWKRPWLRLALRFALKRAREFYPLREERNHVFYTGVGTIQAILHRLGSLWVTRGVLPDPRAIFDLTFEEIGRLVAEGAVSGARRPRGAARRPAGDGPPGRHSRSLPYAARVLRGVAASGGRARGPARVVLASEDFEGLQPGEIVVCPAIRPYLTPALLLARGLVTDHGGVLSHGANLAREYGVPAVTGTDVATQVIPDGAWIEVDGDAGEVRILDREFH